MVNNEYKKDVLIKLTVLSLVLSNCMQMLITPVVTSKQLQYSFKWQYKLAKLNPQTKSNKISVIQNKPIKASHVMRQIFIPWLTIKMHLIYVSNHPFSWYMIPSHICFYPPTPPFCTILFSLLPANPHQNQNGSLSFIHDINFCSLICHHPKAPSCEALKRVLSGSETSHKVHSLSQSEHIQKGPSW